MFKMPLFVCDYACVCVFECVLPSPSPSHCELGSMLHQLNGLNERLSELTNFMLTIIFHEIKRDISSFT